MSDSIVLTTDVDAESTDGDIFMARLEELLNIREVWSEMLSEQRVAETIEAYRSGGESGEQAETPESSRV